MNSPCILDFFPGEVRFSRAPSDGGEVLGSVDPNAPQAADRVADLRAEVLAGSDGPADAVLRLSADDVLLGTLDPDRSQTEAIHAARVRRALDGMGPRPAADLAHDWVLDGEGRAWIAAISREVLRGAEAFAATHGFRVAGVTAALPPGSFPRAPDFALAGPDGSPRLTPPPRRMPRTGTGPAALRASRPGAAPIRPAREETEWAQAADATAAAARSRLPLLAGALVLIVAAFALWTVYPASPPAERPEVEIAAAGAPQTAPVPELPEATVPESAAAPSPPSEPVLLPIALLDAPAPAEDAASEGAGPRVQVTRGPPRARPPSRPVGIAAAPTGISAPRPRPDTTPAQDDDPAIRALVDEASAAIADTSAPEAGGVPSPAAAAPATGATEAGGAAASPGAPQARPPSSEPPAVPDGPVEAALRAAISDGDAVAATPEASASDAASALARSLRPDSRPGDLRALDSPAATPRATTPQADAPAPTTPRVAAAPAPEDATDGNALRLDRPSLIGVYGTQSNRRALVRLPNGRFVKVQVGDRVDGGRVSDIDLDQLRYTKGGRAVSLSMPRG